MSLYYMDQLFLHAKMYYIYKYVSVYSKGVYILSSPLSLSSHINVIKSNQLVLSYAENNNNSIDYIVHIVQSIKFYRFCGSL